MDAKSKVALKENQSLYKKYKICRVLGQGSFSILYECEDKIENSFVVIKEFFQEDRCSRNIVNSNLEYLNEKKDKELLYQLYENEVSILKKVNHLDGCLKIRDYFIENNTFYIVTDCIKGTNLQEQLFLYENSLQKVVTLIVQIADVLEKVHATNIVHRDICTDNIMVSDTGEITVIDFGSAIDLNITNNPYIEEPTYRYGFSPLEQMKYEGRIDKRSDIYSLTSIMLLLYLGKEKWKDTVENREELLKLTLVTDKMKNQNLIDFFYENMSTKIEERCENMGKFRKYITNI